MTDSETEETSPSLQKMRKFRRGFILIDKKSNGIIARVDEKDRILKNKHLAYKTGISGFVEGEQKIHVKKIMAEANKQFIPQKNKKNVDEIIICCPEVTDVEGTLCFELRCLVTTRTLYTDNSPASLDQLKHIIKLSKEDCNKQDQVSNTEVTESNFPETSTRNLANEKATEKITIESATNTLTYEPDLNNETANQVFINKRTTQKLKNGTEPRQMTKETEPQKQNNEAAKQMGKNETITKKLTNETITDSPTNQTTTQKLSSEILTQKLTYETVIKQLTNETVTMKLTNETATQNETSTWTLTNNTTTQNLTNETETDNLTNAKQKLTSKSGTHIKIVSPGSSEARCWSYNDVYGSQGASPISPQGGEDGVEDFETSEENELIEEPFQTLKSAGVKCSLNPSTSNTKMPSAPPLPSYFNYVHQSIPPLPSYLKNEHQIGYSFTSAYKKTAPKPSSIIAQRSAHSLQTTFPDQQKSAEHVTSSENSNTSSEPTTHPHSLPIKVITPLLISQTASHSGNEILMLEQENIQNTKRIKKLVDEVNEKAKVIVKKDLVIKNKDEIIQQLKDDKQSFLVNQISQHEKCLAQQIHQIEQKQSHHPNQQQPKHNKQQKSQEKGIMCKIVAPPSQVSSLHNQIINGLEERLGHEGHYLSEGETGLSIVIAVNTSRLVSDVKRDLGKTGLKDVPIMLLIIKATRNFNDKPSIRIRDLKDERIKEACYILVDLNFSSIHSCQFNHDSFNSVSNFLKNFRQSGE